MLWRGFVPLVGQLWQSTVTPPDTCSKGNTGLTASMQGELADFESTAQAAQLSLWTQADRMLSDVVVIGSATADLLVLPLSNRLMYLYASAVALALLAMAALFTL